MEYGKRPKLDEAIKLRNSYYKGWSVGRRLGGADEVQNMLVMGRLFPRKLSEEEVMFWQKGFYDAVRDRVR